MATERFTVEVQPDFIERQAKARPIDALAEIIWNGLDADATRVDVRLGHGEFGLSSITVTDNDVTGEFCTRENVRETGTRGAEAWHGRSTVRSRSSLSCDKSKSN